MQSIHTHVLYHQPSTMRHFWKGHKAVQRNIEVFQLPQVLLDELYQSGKNLVAGGQSIK